MILGIEDFICINIVETSVGDGGLFIGAFGAIIDEYNRNAQATAIGVSPYNQKILDQRSLLDPIIHLCGRHSGETVRPNLAQLFVQAA